MDATPPVLPPITRTPYFPGGQRLAFFLFMMAILALAYYTVRPVLVSVLLAAGVASLSYRIYGQLVTALKGRGRLGAVLMLLAIIVCLLGPLGALVVLLTRRIVLEIEALVPRLPDLEGDIRRFAEHAGPLGPGLRRAADQLGGLVSEAVPRIVQHLTEYLGAAGGALVEFGAGLFLFCVSVYYFYLNGAPWRERLIRLLPIEQRYSRAFIARFRSVSIAVLVGNLGTAAIHGVISGIGYWIFGVEAPVLWGMVTAFASFIPLIGTAIVWVPLSIVLATTSGWLHGLLLLVYCVVVITASDYLARPFLMERRLGVHPLFVFIAIFGGLAGFGPAGIFLGPLIMALTVAALDLYEADGDGPVHLIETPH